MTGNRKYIDSLVKRLVETTFLQSFLPSNYTYDFFVSKEDLLSNSFFNKDVIKSFEIQTSHIKDIKYLITLPYGDKNQHLFIVYTFYNLGKLEIRILDYDYDILLPDRYTVYGEDAPNNNDFIIELYNDKIINQIEMGELSE
jgi:hypothetical protein